MSITQLSAGDADQIVVRLAQIKSLRVPGQLTRNDQPTTVESRSDYLRKLLTNDPGVFLERHHELLTTSEVAVFQPLRESSYEVDFYLKIIEDKQLRQETIPGTSEWGRTSVNDRQQLSRPVSAVAKNRRFAELARLEKRGYFTDEAMRTREPYLHHLYIGKYAENDAAAENVAAPATAGAQSGSHGEAAAAPEDDTRELALPGAAPALADSIMARQEELELMLRRDAEREAYEMQGEESESESEGEEEERKGAATEPMQNAPEYITEAERQVMVEYAETFHDIMRQKFLSGQDPDIDYGAIDADADLDEDFAEETRRDAEDDYFDN